jgi:chaperonin cofactor prefoldin
MDGEVQSIRKGRHIYEQLGEVFFQSTPAKVNANTKLKLETSRKSIAEYTDMMNRLVSEYESADQQS